MAKRKLLQPEQEEDAKRLSALWEKNKALAKEPLSQEKFAATYEIGTDGGTQGAIWQYLNARIPLNLEALIKFAHYLGVTPETISPTVAKPLQWLPNQIDVTEKARNDDERGLLREYRSIHPKHRAAVRQFMTTSHEERDALSAVFAAPSMKGEQLPVAPPTVGKLRSEKRAR